MMFGLLALVTALILILKNQNQRPVSFPSIISGTILNQDHQPVKDTEIRLYNFTNEDITDGIAITDEDGYYLLHCQLQEIPASAKIKLLGSNCQNAALIQLSESKVSYDKEREVFVFTHFANCSS